MGFRGTRRDELTNDDLAAIAAGAPTVARVRAFVDWVGAGHALTQTGRLRRDDGPRCTDGAGRCPPEDVGGTPGYEDLRRVLADPEQDGHTEMLEWLGLEHAGDFDAAAFSLERANAAIVRVLTSRSA